MPHDGSVRLGCTGNRLPVWSFFVSLYPMARARPGFDDPEIVSHRLGLADVQALRSRAPISTGIAAFPAMKCRSPRRGDLGLLLDPAPSSSSRERCRTTEPHPSVNVSRGWAPTNPRRPPLGRGPPRSKGRSEGLACWKSRVGYGSETRHPGEVVVEGPGSASRCRTRWHRSASTRIRISLRLPPTRSTHPSIRVHVASGGGRRAAPTGTCVGPACPGRRHLSGSRFGPGQRWPPHRHRVDHAGGSPRAPCRNGRRPSRQGRQRRSRAETPTGTPLRSRHARLPLDRPGQCLHPSTRRRRLSSRTDRTIVSALARRFFLTSAATALAVAAGVRSSPAEAPGCETAGVARASGSIQVTHPVEGALAQC